MPKFLTIIIACLLAGLVASILLYIVGGHQCIKAMYEGHAYGLFNHIIESQDIYSLEHYYAQADWFFYTIMSVLFTAVLLLYLSLYRKVKVVFYGIVIVYIVYCIVFIIRSSIVVDGTRYFLLFDDGMISMRYAKNFAAGYGLVWNPGDIPVEGYTNFLWTIYMAVWHLMPIAASKMALPIQITGAVLLVASLFITRKIAAHISGGNAYVWLGSVIVTASYLASNFWGLKGMETAALGLIVLFVIWKIILFIDNKQPLNLFVFLLLGVSLWVRIDYLLFYIFIMIYLFFVVPPKQRIKCMIKGFLVFFFMIGIITLFRLYYYHDIVPNTYYLKMSDIPLTIRLKKGFDLIQAFIQKMSIVLFMLPFIYCFLKRADKRVWLLLSSFLIQLCYTLYVGGDFFESWHLASRFMINVMPCFFILLCLMVYEVMMKCMMFFQMKQHQQPIFKKLCFSGILCLLIFQLHGGFSFPYFQTHIQMFSFLGYIDMHKRCLHIALQLKPVTSPQTRIAITAAGIIPYFTDRYSIDLLGKSDVYIARQRAKVAKDGWLYPGHNKYDYDYSIGKFNPDIVQKINWMNTAEFNQAYTRYLAKDYRTVEICGEIFFIKKDSPYIAWDVIEKDTVNYHIVL